MVFSGNSGRTTALAAAVVAALTAAVWLTQAAGDDGDGGGDGGGDHAPAPSPSTSYSATIEVTPSPSATLPETDPASGLPYVALSELPPEAADVVALIDEGGPFPYDEDGSTFGNFEGLLPDRPDGYYREYTVETPGSEDRGARRIVGGGEGELYWTGDHYESFEVIWR